MSQLNRRSSRRALRLRRLRFTLQRQPLSPRQRLVRLLRRCACPRRLWPHHLPRLILRPRRSARPRRLRPRRRSFTLPRRLRPRRRSLTLPRRQPRLCRLRFVSRRPLFGSSRRSGNRKRAGGLGCRPARSSIGTVSFADVVGAAGFARSARAVRQVSDGNEHPICRWRSFADGSGRQSRQGLAFGGCGGKREHKSGRGSQAFLSDDDSRIDPRSARSGRRFRIGAAGERHHLARCLHCVGERRALHRASVAPKRILSGRRPHPPCSAGGDSAGGRGSAGRAVARYDCRFGRRRACPKQGRAGRGNGIVSSNARS